MEIPGELLSRGLPAPGGISLYYRFIHYQFVSQTATSKATLAFLASLCVSGGVGWEGGERLRG